MVSEHGSVVRVCGLIQPSTVNKALGAGVPMPTFPSEER